MILADWLAEQPFTLAMSSGFFSFFAHTGMLAALDEHGLHPRAVAGSSAGALVGGAWAAGLSPPEFAAILGGLSRAQFWDPAPGLGLLAGRRFDELLRDMLPVTTFGACRVPVAISVFDIVRRSTTVVRDGDLPRAIRASCAVPAMFQPVWIAGRACWDGGILDRPGLAGVPTGDRVLYHHISSRSPWRRQSGLAVPRRANQVTLVIDNLPRSGPFRLDAGRQAMAMAREATCLALARPIECEEVRIELT